ncbi:hypothetical protein Fmac_026808 [Flemingia macrophylla]|uniref:Uncharacterized protein n=1 Tax=Flemingia macrophylla TaxID=520843 RepID=A0ABD1LFX0_9FABA
MKRRLLLTLQDLFENSSLGFNIRASEEQMRNIKLSPSLSINKQGDPQLEKEYKAFHYEVSFLKVPSFAPYHL